MDAIACAKGKYDRSSNYAPVSIGLVFVKCIVFELKSTGKRKTEAVEDMDTTGADTSFCKMTGTVVGVCPSFSTPPWEHLQLISNLASASQTQQVQAAKYPEDENRASTENFVLRTVVNMLIMIASQEKL